MPLLSDLVWLLGLVGWFWRGRSIGELLWMFCQAAPVCMQIATDDTDNNQHFLQTFTKWFGEISWNSWEKVWESKNVSLQYKHVHTYMRSCRTILGESAHEKKWNRKRVSFWSHLIITSTCISLWEHYIDIIQRHLTRYSFFIQ